MRPRVLLTLTFALAALLAGWVLAKKLHRFAYWTAPKTAAQVDALAQNGWRADRFAPAPGVELCGLVRAPTAANARWIVFLPGNSSDLLAGFREVLTPLAANGARGIAFWAYRGFDASTGVPSPAVLAHDAEQCWQRALQLAGGDAQRVELWGYSLGSGLAVQLAATLCARGTPPARVVLLSAYDRITVMPFGPFGRLQPSDVYDALAAAPQVTCPTVLVHGTADDALPIAGARTLQRAIGSAARFVELPGKWHADWLGELGQLDFGSAR